MKRGLTFFSRWRFTAILIGAYFALAAVGFAQSAGGSVQIAGTINLGFLAITDSNGIFLSWDFTGVNSVDLEASVDSLTLPVSVGSSYLNGSTNYWNDPRIWNNAALDLANAVTVVPTVLGIIGLDPTVIPDIAPTINTLGALGPTEQTFSIPVPVEGDGIPGFPLNFNVGVGLEYAVTLPTGANIIMNQNNVTVQSLTVDSGASLSANNTLVTLGDLVNHGLINNLGGTIKGNFVNDGDPSTGAGALVTGNLIVDGSFCNTGSMTIESGGILTSNASITNAGTMNLDGDSLNISGTFTNAGNFQWISGALSNQFVNAAALVITATDGKTLNTLINTGTITLAANSANTAIDADGVFNNYGTTTHTGSGSLLFNGTIYYGNFNDSLAPAVLNNLTGALYDLQGDAGFQPGPSSIYGDSINNAGTFLKSGGIGISTVAANVTFNNTGTVEVDSGTLEFDNSGDSSDNGSFVLTNGSQLTFAGSLHLSGTNTFTGNGTIAIPGSITQTDNGSNTFSGSQLTVNMDGTTLHGVTIASNFNWTSGDVILTNSSSNFVISGTEGKSISSLTNNGTITLAEGSRNTAIDADGVFNNYGTITHTGSGSLLFNGTIYYGNFNDSLAPAVLNNLTGALYDLQGDAGFQPGPSSIYGDSINNAGTFLKSGGIGISTVAANVTFNNTGTVEVDSGTLEFDNSGDSSDNGSFVLTNGSQLTFAGSLHLSGTNTFTGNGTIAIPGSITQTDNGSNTFSGSQLTVNMDGTTLHGVTIASNFNWTSGDVILTNSSSNFVISGTEGKSISSLTNNGTITHLGGSTVGFDFGATLNNEAGALYAFQGDGAEFVYDAGYNNASINNAGTFLKSSGTGTSMISTSNVSFHNTGTVEVDSGTIEFSSGGDTSTGGNFVLANGGQLTIAGNLTLYGTNTFTGNGTINVESTISQSDNGPDIYSGSQLTVNLDGGRMLNGGLIASNFNWIAGEINGLTNTSASFLISGTSGLTLDNLINSGTITHMGSATVGFSFGATLTNQAGALYAFQGDGAEFVYNAGYNNATINNAGTFLKSSGTGTSMISTSNVSFHNTGTVEVDSGTIEFSSGGDTSTGGNFVLANGGQLTIAGNLTLYGTNTFTGNGAINVESTISQSDNGPDTYSGSQLTVNLDGGRMLNGGLIASNFNWIAGEINGLTNTSASFLISGTSGLTLDNLINSGTITHMGSATVGFSFGATLTNQAGALYAFQGDGSGFVYNAGYNNGTINNAGTFLRSSGTGTSTIGSSISFNNTGIVEVDSGTLQFQGGVSQLSGNTLTGGTWKVFNNATLSLSGNITNNQGTVTMSGTDSNFPAINTLANNQGSFSILNGRGFITAGDLQNSGLLTVGQGSNLKVSGNLSLLDGGSLTMQIGGLQESADDGTLTVTGSASLGGALVLSFANNFETQLLGNETFTLLTAADPITGDFSDVADGARLETADGLGSFIVNYGPSSPYGADVVVLSQPEGVPEPGVLGLLLPAIASLAWAYARRSPSRRAN